MSRHRELCIKGCPMADQQANVAVALSSEDGSKLGGTPGVLQPFGTEGALSVPESYNEETSEHATAAGETAYMPYCCKADE